MNRPKYLIVHHTGGTESDPLADTSHHTFEIVDNWHRQLWNWRSSLGHYIGYHYFIDREGKVTQGRADDEAGAHVIGKNKSSIGICLAGNFDRIGENSEPSEKQEKSLTGLLKKLSKAHGINPRNIVPHREFSNKTCYGSNLSDDWARSLVKDTSQQPKRLDEYSTIVLINELKRRIRESDL